MHFVREIWLRHVKYACGRVRDLFHFISNEVRYFTIFARKLFHIRYSRIFHLKEEWFYAIISLRKAVVGVAESKLRDLSMDFSVKIIKLCDNIKGHHSLVNQLERSATSIGANIHEANYAHGKADFVAKLQISLKECYETDYWIELFVKSDLIERDIAKNLYNQCGTIRRILIASINTAKENK